MFGGIRRAGRTPSAPRSIPHATLLAAALLFAPTAFAQEDGGDDPTASDRQAAAEAYDRGSSAYLSRNYEQAARYFETADRFAPSPAALVQAIRAHDRAGNDLRAANLALRLGARYPDDENAQRTSGQVLGEAEGQYYRVDVECDGCTVLVDGSVLDWPSFFVEPDTERTVTANFETGAREEVVRGPAGGSRQLSFEAPPPPVEEPGPEPVDPEPVRPVTPTEPVDEGGGLSSTWFFVAGALTIVAGGATAWSGVDTLEGVDAYEEEAASGDPAEARQMLEEGQDKELRTNILIGATAGLAAITVILAAVTDWSGEESAERDPNLSASVGVVPGGGAAVVGGTF